MIDRTEPPSGVAALTPGTRLGPYEIVAPIGSGGMGELFRARDDRLGRDVAIKVPRAAVVGDSARRQRFQREARAIATLNHPHICTVYDVGFDSGLDYLVLELLQGESLAERLTRGPLPVEEALTRAIEIAGALASAHRAGIVHRDLKPGNVMLTPSGAKVLDFGLARITRGDPDAPTATRGPDGAPLTGTGAVVGTLPYMAPEQLEGRAADTRSDIYAFGATLFEMLAGKRAFDAPSSAGIVAVILRGDTPSLLALRPDLPSALDRLVRTCLARDPEGRFESLHDVIVTLQWVREDLRNATASVPAAVGAVVPRRRRSAMAIGATLAVSAAFAGGAAWRVLPTGDAREVRFSIQPPPMPNPAAVAVSPDGQTIAFVAETSDATLMLFLRSLGSLQARMLPGTEDAFAPFWSPDGQYVGFGSRTDRKLKIVGIAGGEPRVVCDLAGPLEQATMQGASWSREGVIVFSTSGQIHRSPEVGPGLRLHRVSATGGIPSILGDVDRAGGETGHSWPHFLPDGRRFLYLSWNDDPAKRAIVVASVDWKERTRVMLAESMASYVAPGYLLFTKQERLLAQRFDVSTMRLSGEPLPLADGLLFVPGRAAFSASSLTLAYRNRGSEETGFFSLAWMDRGGKVTTSFPDTFGARSIRLAPDGKRVALTDFRPETSNDIWIYDLERNHKTLLAGGRDTEHWPVWSPDGSRIRFDRGAFDSLHTMYEQRVDRAVPEQQLLRPEPGFGYGALDWTTRYFIFLSTRRKGEIELWAQAMPGDQKAFRAVAGLRSETTAAVSPNGRWLAYVDPEGGAYNLVLRSFPDPSRGRHVISTHGLCPRWRQDGRELYFLGADGGIHAVSIAAEGDLALAKSERLFAMPVNPPVVSAAACPYDVTADGQRFIVALPGGANRTAPIQVALNWSAGFPP